MPRKMLDLAKQCEAAEGKDALFPSKLIIKAYDLIWPKFDDGPSDIFKISQHGGYTDAIIMMIPEAPRRMIEQQTFCSGAKGEPERSWARINITNENGYTIGGEASAATPALALLAAVLRTRCQMK